MAKGGAQASDVTDLREIDKGPWTIWPKAPVEAQQSFCDDFGDIWIVDPHIKSLWEHLDADRE